MVKTTHIINHKGKFIKYDKEGGNEDFETQSLKFQQPPSLAAQFFRSPSPPPPFYNNVN